MSSSGHLSPPTTRRTRMRSLSPNAVSAQKTAESPQKCAKLSKPSDVKEETQSDSNDSKSDEPSKDAEQDCPAFRLRPRRSTPKPSTSTPAKRLTAMLNRLKYLKDNTAVKRELIFNTQKVYPSTFNSELNSDRVIPPRSPNCSIKEDIFVSPFVQKISLSELETDMEYAANYISLRINSKHSMQTSEEKLIKVIASDIEFSNANMPSIDKKKSGDRKIAIYLYGSYADCKAEVNKVINIVKFKTQSKLENDDDIGCQFPYAIVVRSCDNSWVPFVSITSNWKAPEDPKVLNQTLFMSPEERPVKDDMSSCSSSSSSKK